MKYYLILLIFLLTSCDIEGFMEDRRKELEQHLQDSYTVIVIDGCEYLEFQKNLTGTTPVYSVTHKGNCSYCAERNLAK